MVRPGMEFMGDVDRTPLGFVPTAESEHPDYVGQFVDTVGDGVKELGTGLKNWWYNFTGQTEKTSAYQAQLEQEKHKIQTLAEDMEAAGLSKYAMSVSGSSPNSVAGDQEPKGLQYIAAMMDLKKQSAEIENINANSSKTAAEADYIGKQSESYPERVAVEIALNKANTELARNNGQLAAEKIITEIQMRSQSAAMHLVQLAQEQARTGNINADTWLKGRQGAKLNADIELLGKEIGSYDARRAEERGYNIARTANLGAQSTFTFKQIENVSSEIAYRIAQTEHLSAQDEKIAADTASILLMSAIAGYDYDYSISNGLRYKDSNTSLLGINASQIGSILSRIVEKGTSGIANMWNMLFNK